MYNLVVMSVSLEEQALFPGRFEQWEKAFSFLSDAIPPKYADGHGRLILSLTTSVRLPILGRRKVVPYRSASVRAFANATPTCEAGPSGAHSESLFRARARAFLFE